MGIMAQKQPKWVDKARKAVIAVSTYGKDGNKIASTNGFFISETGEAVSDYDAFKGASKAVVQDIDGNQYEVKTILGADDMYDVIKFQVSTPKKVQYLETTTSPVATGTTVYLLPFSTLKIANLKNGQITEASNLKGDYKYYKLEMKTTPADVSLPLLTAEGQVVALTQADASGKADVTYGVSAGFVKNDVNVSSMDFLGTAYKKIGIPAALPKDEEQASVVLYLRGNNEDATTHLQTINDFIASFPNSSEGYNARANHYAYHRSELPALGGGENEYLSKALADIETAGKLSGKKGETDYNKAKIVYSIVVADSTVTAPGWSMADASAYISSAIKANPDPIYRQLNAEMLLVAGKYQEAFDEYKVVNESDMASASSYYMAAKCLENIPGFNIGDVIDLLDKAIEKGESANSAEVPAMILERIDWRLRLTQYKEATADYDKYFVAVGGNVTPQFYYLREQSKFRSEDYEGALSDIQKAILSAPSDPDMYAEEATVYVKLKKYDEALTSLDKAIELAPDFGACYRLKGICYLRTNKKKEACAALTKAEDLNDPLAAKLKKENCQ
jgi:tetratricopeptide (TPR) repeat protein